MTPVRTSPAPAVPSAGFAVGLMNTVPSGRAISVRAPLSTTIARVSAASLRADADPRALHLGGGRAQQARHLARVRREHARRRRRRP